MTKCLPLTKATSRRKPVTFKGCLAVSFRLSGRPVASTDSRAASPLDVDAKAFQKSGRPIVGRRSARNKLVCLRRLGRYTLGKIAKPIVRKKRPPEVSFMPVSNRPEHLIRALFVHPSRVELTFADGLIVRPTLSEIEIDTAGLNLPTIS